MERPTKSANDRYAITPIKPLVSQSANGRLPTAAVAPAPDAPDAPDAAKKDTDEYFKYFPEDETQIDPDLEEVLDLDTKSASNEALKAYKIKNGIIGGKKSKTKKSKTKKRKIRLTKKQNKNKKKKRSQKEFNCT